MHYLFLAGIGNSEHDHWQRIWWRSLGPNGHWLEHADWDNPVADTWVDDLERCVGTLFGPKVFIAHSLSCLLVAEWTKRHGAADVAGAFLVAVPDPQGPAFPREAIGFGHALEGGLPFPAVMIASTNDKYGTLAHAQRVSGHWRVPLVSVGEKGHINLASSLGDWPKGRAMLDEFVASLKR